MKRFSLVIWSLMTFSTVLFTACGGNDSETQKLEVSKNMITFSFSGGVDFFDVDANCAWTIELDNTQSWLTVDPMSSNDSLTSRSVALTASPNNSTNNRSTKLTVVSEDGQLRREISVTQAKVEINPAIGKVWFLRFYERWNTDYWNNYIPESYRTWTYYTDFEFENWYFYFFDDNTGYQINTHAGDTISYPYQYHYYPEGDSLLIVFEANSGNTIEDYHAVIHELNDVNFSFSDAYRPHYYEKLNMINVTGSKNNTIKINPKTITTKPAGPLIPVK